MYYYSIKAVYKMHERGVELYIGGRAATPEMVESLLRKNDSKRMPKICFNKQGDISKVDYI